MNFVFIGSHCIFELNTDGARYNFSTLALLIAVVFAGILGDMNFWYNMQPYYDVELLNLSCSLVFSKFIS